jgi:hypothetical protein
MGGGMVMFSEMACRTRDRGLGVLDSVPPKEKCRWLGTQQSGEVHGDEKRRAEAGGKEEKR